MPKDERGRHVCTADDPWKPEHGTPAIHPDAVSGEDVDYGLGEYCATYKCPHCKKYFEVALSQ